MSERSVLADIRRALGRSESITPPPLSPALLPGDDEQGEHVVARFIEEVTAVRGLVHHAHTSQEVAERVSDICRSTGASEVALSGSALLSEMKLAAQLAARGMSTIDAAGFRTEEREELIARLASCGAGITSIDYAVAETGTIVLSSDEQQSLLVSLVPPVHIAVLLPSQIGMTIAGAVRWLSEERMGRGEPCRSASFITGPSRTGDVELTLSIGVHGPKELHLILISVAAC
jgi:L-lactate dehydrogenase complex protein LldG